MTAIRRNHHPRRHPLRRLVVVGAAHLGLDLRRHGDREIDRLELAAGRRRRLCAVRRRPRRRHPLRLSRRRRLCARARPLVRSRTSCWSIPMPSRSTGPMSIDRRLAARRGEGADTAPLMPKAIATRSAEAAAGQAAALPARRPDLRTAGPRLHHAASGRAAKHSAARSPRSPIRRSSSICKKLGVSAVELMPVTAWIDERHLPPLGPAAMPGATIRSPSWRSIRAWRPAAWPNCARRWRRCARPASASSSISSSTTPAKATGSGRRCRCAASTTRPTTGTSRTAGWSTTPAPATRSPATIRSCGEMVLDTLRHFVRHAGVDGFRFDLAPVLGRVDGGFDPEAPLLRAIADDPVLADRVLIAEPWDIGPDGYQLGNFPPPFLEWNDRYRDDVRRFWRGDRRHGRRAGDAACRLVRCVRQGRASSTAARSISSPRMTA